MTDPLVSPTIRQRTLPRSTKPYLVEAIGSISLADASQPKIKLALVPFRDNQVDFKARDAGRELLLDVHVADLMTLGPGIVIEDQLRVRTPKTLLKQLKVPLDMHRQEVVRFQDLESLLGPKGAYPFITPWEAMKNLQCLRFKAMNGSTVLIPCLDAWRFTLASSSVMLQASCRPEFQTDLLTARSLSTLETMDGQHLTLPLTMNSEDAELAIEQGTLHLHVPDGFLESDLPTLAWLVTDERAFKEAARFFSAIVAGRAVHATSKSAVMRSQSCPSFKFPFTGQPMFKLHGTWVQPLEPKVFLALHIEHCNAEFPMPREIKNPQFPAPPIEDQAPVGPGLQFPSEIRNRKPVVDSSTEGNSLKPPDHRLTTVVLSLHRNRLGSFKKTKLATDPEKPIKPAPHRRSDGFWPTPIVSGGDPEPGGGGGRHISVVEKPPEEPIPSRPVDHIAQFSDLSGVCEELRKKGVESEFYPIDRADLSDPTTPIPASPGVAARWVGVGVTARRALIARLTQENRVAYALEWERFSTDEYGKLLLISAGTVDIPPKHLLTLLASCAEGRGVWPANTLGPALLVGIHHRKPHREYMSEYVINRLEAYGWFSKAGTQGEAVVTLHPPLIPPNNPSLS